MRISEAVSGQLADIVRDRRALHRMPEDGLAEHKTQRYILDALTPLTPDVLMPCAGTGVKAVFCAGSKAALSGERSVNHQPGFSEVAGDTPAPAIAFRADMDALPITESANHDYCSAHAGFMHACGHDGHMAGLLALARLVAARRADLTRGVVLLFQPAEESHGGAQRMLDAGAFSAPQVGEVYGMHVMPDLPVGTLASRVGPMMAAVNNLDITITGKRAHGAAPHAGIDAIAAAAHLYTLLQTSIARQLDPCEPALLTVGRLEAGEARNVIAEHAKLLCTARTFSDAHYAALMDRVRADMRAVEIAFGVTCVLAEGTYYPCVHNDADCVARVMELAGGAYRTADARMIAEDFAYYQRAAKGAFVYCGCGDAGHTASLHTDRFDFDECALLYGVELFMRLIGLI